MTLQECYQALGGSYDEVLRRLMSPKLVEKFIIKFLSDGSYATLCAAMAAGQRPEAFRAAHTIKGICQNLGFGNLLRSVEPLTELLRPQAESIPDGAAALLSQVQKDYDGTVLAIRAYRQSRA
ncbi:MAG: Hpt domain-containing protein [Aristaeellaceae bacterium]